MKNSTKNSTGILVSSNTLKFLYSVQHNRIDQVTDAICKNLFIKIGNSYINSEKHVRYTSNVYMNPLNTSVLFLGLDADFENGFGFLMQFLNKCGVVTFK